MAILRLLLADDIAAGEKEGRTAIVKLRCRFENTSHEDKIDFYLNNTPLRIEKQTYPTVLKAHGPIYYQSCGQKWYEMDVPKRTLIRGWNEIQVAIKEGRALRQPLTLAEAHVLIEYH